MQKRIRNIGPFKVIRRKPISSGKDFLIYSSSLKRSTAVVSFQRNMVRILLHFYFYCWCLHEFCCFLHFDSRMLTFDSLYIYWIRNWILVPTAPNTVRIFSCGAFAARFFDTLIFLATTSFDSCFRPSHFVLSIFYTGVVSLGCGSTQGLQSQATRHL